MEISYRAPEASRKSASVRKAYLSVEPAAEITRVPTGVTDGGGLDQHDKIYQLAFRRLSEMGHDDREIDATFEKLLPELGYRVWLLCLTKTDRGLYPHLIENLAGMHQGRATTYEESFLEFIVEVSRKTKR